MILEFWLLGLVAPSQPPPASAVASQEEEPNHLPRERASRVSEEGRAGGQPQVATTPHQLLSNDFLTANRQNCVNNTPNHAHTQHNPP